MRARRIAVQEWARIDSVACPSVPTRNGEEGGEGKMEGSRRAEGERGEGNGRCLGRRKEDEG
jgi:hypothetical protein